MEPKVSPKQIDSVSVAVLTPGQVGMRWYKLYPMLKTLYGDLSDTAFTNIMGGIASGALTVFEIGAEFKGKTNCVGAVLVELSTRNFTKTKICNVFGAWVHPVAHLKMSAWRQVYEIVERFAKQEQCDRLTAYTTNVRAQKIMESLGFAFQSYGEKKL